jgi:hypothetical protein
LANTLKSRGILDTKATNKIQYQTHCDRSCPAFPLCPLMPLAIQPKVNKERVCLIKFGPPEIQRAYANLFSNGHSGIIEEIQRGILEYGKILREAKKTEFSPKERLRHIKEMNTMLMNLDKMLGKNPTKDDEKEDEQIVIDPGDEKVKPPEKNPILEKYFPEEPNAAN